MPDADSLGAAQPMITLYLPHRPNRFAGQDADPDAVALMAANSNHWRKIVTLLAKVACPIAADWRCFRDESLLRATALNFAPELSGGSGWHWIGGKENLQRFDRLHHRASPLSGEPEIAMDVQRRLLLTPYPDYRQLSNAMVMQVRAALEDQGFYAGADS